MTITIRTTPPTKTTTSVNAGFVALTMVLALAACSDTGQQKFEMAQDHVRKLNKASDFFYIEKKKCPPDANALARLFTGKDENTYDFNKDPWGNPFIMVETGKACRFKSLGADGQEGGSGFDADIE